jgi:alkanesulfonate monooxygenase SsuD/methylene tetrahydromethanopterin reductase-like flavin-dependent oxidoreductase (luciferase family)
MAEYVELVRLILSGPDGLAFKGRFYDIDFPQFHLPQQRDLTAKTELYGAALAPIMTRYMAASCDGVALHALALVEPYFEEVSLPAIRRGAQLRGRMPRIAAWIIVTVDGNEENARQAARRQLAFYFSTPSYGATVAGHRWAPIAAAIRDEAKRRQYRDWQEIGKVIPDDMVDGLALAGTPRQFRDKLAAVERRLGALGVDEMVFQIVEGADSAETLTNALAVIEAATGKP